MWLMTGSHVSKRGKSQSENKKKNNVSRRRLDLGNVLGRGQLEHCFAGIVRCESLRPAKP